MNRFKIYQFILLLVFSILLCAVSAEALICSAAVASKPLEIQNWQGKIDLKNLSLNFASDNVVYLSGYLNTNYRTVYLRLQENDSAYIADLNKALIFSAYMYESMMDLFTGYPNQTSYYLAPSYSGSFNFKSVNNTGVVSSLGVMIAKTVSDENTKIIFSDVSGNLQIFDSSTGIILPYFNGILKENISNIKNYGLILEDGRILFSKNTICDSCELSMGLINKDKLELLTGKLSKEDNSLKLSSGEVIKFGIKIKQPKTLIESQALNTGFKFKGQFVNILTTDYSYSINSLDYASYINNLLAVKSNFDSQFLIVNSDKIICQEEPVFKEPTEVKFLKDSYKDQPACQGKLSSVEDWDSMVKMNPKELFLKKTLAFEEIDFLLQRMLRGEKLTDQEMAFLEFIYQSPVGDHFNDLLVLIVDKFSSQNNYKNLVLFNRFSDYKRKLKAKIENICLNDEVKKVISATYKKLIINKAKNLAALDQNNFNIQKLLFVKSYLSILSLEDKEDVASQIGTVLAESAQRNESQLTGVFFSTLDWFSTQKLREFLGLKPIELTDLLVTSNDSYISIIGTKEIYADDILAAIGVKRSRGGFYITDQAYMNIYNEGSMKYRWYHGNDQFEAEVSKVKRPVTFVPELSEGPDKKQIMEDKYFHGAVVIGANLRGQTLKNTMTNYLYYLKQQKFTVEEPVIIERALEYLRDGITGKKDKLDYFLKEAHSDGDYRNLFSINKKIFLVRAKLQHEDYLEQIDLLYHDDSYDVEFISNQMFGDWLHERENKYNGGQFIYLNTSCNSYTKAAAELGTAASKLLTIVASSSSVYTFSTSPDNSTFHLFDGIRKLLSFDDISKSIKGLKGTYIFPKETSYKSMILDSINAGYITQSKVFKVSDSGAREIFNIESILNQRHNQNN